MVRRRVFIGKAAYPVVMAVVAEAVHRSPGLELYEGAVASEAQLDGLLAQAGAEDIDILVLIGEEDALDVTALLARHPRLRILQIRFRPQAVQVDLRGLDLQQFMRLLHLLADADDEPRTGRQPVLLELDLPPIIPGLPAGDDASGAAAARDDGPWPAVRDWIDAVLLLYQTTRPQGVGDLPGLALAPQALDEALWLPTPEAPEAAAARHRAARALAALDESLRAPRQRWLPLALLRRRLGLTRTEFLALLLCLAPELDVRYQRAFGLVNDDLGRRAPVLGLVCALLGDALHVRLELQRSGALWRWRLLDAAGQPPVGDEALRADPSVVAWLLGDRAALLADPQLQPWIRDRAWPGAWWLRQPADAEQAGALAARLADGDQARRALVVLAGPDLDGWRATLEWAAARAGRVLIRVRLHGDAGALPDAPALAVRLARAARLTRAVVALDAGNASADATVLGPLLALLGDGAQSCVVLVPAIEAVAGLPEASGAAVLLRGRADAAARRAVLGVAAAQAGLRPSAQGLQRLATGFELGLADIDAALRAAGALGAGPHTPPQDTDRLLADACRRVACPALPRYAHRLDAAVDLADVVLPEAQRGQLREIVAQVRNAAQVLEDWGFGRQLPYGRGVAAVFAGPSGTGKTMAARGIAGALGTDAFVVDLSRVVSKYIGETEKHLDAVFEDAQRCAAVLVFDEADALFGRRTEVKDAHDRYANIEVAYLLQRMESFNGLAILTTNLQQNLDTAFLRRLRFVVEFPRPDAVAREALWRGCLPGAAPVQGTLDLPYLAERFELSGGSIRQITLRAAFLAAQQSSPGIAMRHLVEATLGELRKLGMDSARRELTAYAKALRQDPEPAASGIGAEP